MHQFPVWRCYVSYPTIPQAEIGIVGHTCIHIPVQAITTLNDWVVSAVLMAIPPHTMCQ